MKHVFVSLLAVILIAPVVKGQDDEIRSSEIGVSFDLYDYKTAQLIRNTSLGAVFRDKKFFNIKQMSPGLGIYYFRGLTKHIDFAGAFHGSFLSQGIGNKPDDGVDRFQAQLEGTENRINVSRKRFNEAVQDYNTAIVGFPGNLIASIGGFKEKGFFKAAEGADKAPEVKF